MRERWGRGRGVHQTHAQLVHKWCDGVECGECGRWCGCDSLQVSVLASAGHLGLGWDLGGCECSKGEW